MIRYIIIVSIFLVGNINISLAQEIGVKYFKQRLPDQLKVISIQNEIYFFGIQRQTNSGKDLLNLSRMNKVNNDYVNIDFYEIDSDLTLVEVLFDPKNEYFLVLFNQFFWHLPVEKHIILKVDKSGQVISKVEFEGGAGGLTLASNGNYLVTSTNEINHEVLITCYSDTAFSVLWERRFYGHSASLRQNMQVLEPEQGVYRFLYSINSQNINTNEDNQYIMAGLNEYGQIINSDTLVTNKIIVHYGCSNKRLYFIERFNDQSTQTTKMSLLEWTKPENCEEVFEFQYGIWGVNICPLEFGTMIAYTCNDEFQIMSVNNSLKKRDDRTLLSNEMLIRSAVPIKGENGSFIAIGIRKDYSREPIFGLISVLGIGL